MLTLRGALAAGRRELETPTFRNLASFLNAKLSRKRKLLDLIATPLNLEPMKPTRPPCAQPGCETPRAAHQHLCREHYRIYMREYMRDRRAGIRRRPKGATPKTGTPGRENRLAKKKALAAHIGQPRGTCRACGWEPATDHEWKAVDFNHLDPALKSFDFGRSMQRSLEKLKPEAEKCELLCARCHRFEETSSGKGRPRFLPEGWTPAMARLNQRWRKAGREEAHTAALAEDLARSHPVP